MSESAERTHRVTPSRLTPEQHVATAGAALDFATYLDSTPSYRAFLVENYDAVRFTPAETQAITALQGRYVLLAIVEDWCSDVVATLPVFAKMAELTPAIELLILPRPDHPDLAKLYAVQGGRSYVPTYVLLDEAARELDILYERTPPITEAVRGFADQTMAMISKRFPGVAKKDLPPAFVVENMHDTIGFRNTMRGPERAQLMEWLLGAVARGRLASKGLGQ